MNPQQQRQPKPSSPASNSSTSSAGLLSLMLPALGVIAVLVALQGVASRLGSLRPSPVNLVDVEEDQRLTRKQMMKKSPRFGLEDIKVRESTVKVIFRDNAAEDGDTISFSLNRQPYSGTVYLTNAGTAFDLPLNPGANLLAVYGAKDGVGGITFEAVVVDGVKSNTTMTLVPFPEGETAAFNIIRR